MATTVLIPVVHVLRQTGKRARLQLCTVSWLHTVQCRPQCICQAWLRNSSKTKKTPAVQPRKCPPGSPHTGWPIASWTAASSLSIFKYHNEAQHAYSDEHGVNMRVDWEAGLVGVAMHDGMILTQNKISSLSNRNTIPKRKNKRICFQHTAHCCHGQPAQYNSSTNVFQELRKHVSAKILGVYVLSGPPH